MIRIGIQWFLNQTGPTATSHIESGGFVRSRPGVEHPDIMWHFMPSEVCEHGQKAPTNEAFQVRSSVKDSFINLDQDLLKVVKISGQVESTVQDKITQKWIQIFWLYFLPLKI